MKKIFHNSHKRVNIKKLITIASMTKILNSLTRMKKNMNTGRILNSTMNKKLKKWKLMKKMTTTKTLHLNVRNLIVTLKNMKLMRRNTIT